MGDLEYEGQEAVISSNHLVVDSKEADALEYVIKLNDINGIEDILNKVGIIDYTLNLKKLKY